MIVTKKIADQYILKRGCWLIHELPNGEYSMSYESLNWKEGMEIFETSEECAAEIRRRIKAKMKPGDCPACHHKNYVEAEVDVTALDLITGKYDPFYRCNKCKTVWYKKEPPIYFAYNPLVADYALDWNSRDLKPTKEQLAHLSKNISSDKREGVYLQSVTLKNGSEHPCAIILLKNEPPPAHWFEHKDLYFLDQVAEIRPSPYAYSFEISKKAWKDRGFISVKDIQSGQHYRFDAGVAMFKPVELANVEFALATTDDNTDVKMIAERNDRGTPSYWYFTRPPGPVYIWGDKA